VAVVGWHNAGKTTFIVRLVREGLRRGYRIAVAKHTGGPFEMDRPGTDTDLFAQAGAQVVGILGPTGMAWRESWTEEEPLAAVLARLPDGLDWVILEGYKEAPVLKIEVWRPELGRPRIVPDEELVALVSSEPGETPALLTVTFEQAGRVWDALERRGASGGLRLGSASAR
jgi:FdhD protein